MLEKRIKILRLAEKLLAVKGLYNLSMKQETSKSRIATGTIYLCFKSKNDLVQELHQQNLMSLAAFLFDNYDESQTLKKRFIYLWHRMWEFGLLYPESILCKPEFAKLPETIQQQEESLARNLFAPLGKIYEEGVQQKVFRNLPPAVLAAISFEPCTNLLRQQIIGQLTLNSNEVEEAALSCLAAILLRQKDI
ncbi:TetR/AcrR family transcriptional regulator [Glaciecola petra]|uniref:TetR/AcrR family transcriptional regulator n=1 Tax=Glaciecola petra TaxID=3075602 RepID=A0ABU2ZPJ7_9ALTE|nr:TetR/AcrR family transcriptional regulator [Aestuariibacter sp. P117]MDT0594538.1 TetR/AcrR family transcriptional regulator [Aestuariibacter sp. P117]